MLPRENRLRAKYDFNQVKRFGRSLDTPLFGLSFWRPRSQSPGQSSRFGFIVSKRFCKKASERNRAKRKLRETVRLWLKAQPLTTRGIYRDVVLVARPALLKSSYEEINRWLVEVLPKVFKP